MDFFDKLAGKIKSRGKSLFSRLRAYFKRLLFPVYLFPIKLLSYTVYYIVKFVIKLILAFIGLIIDCIIYPFKGLKNFLKSIFIVSVVLYLFASLFVIADYINRQYGWAGSLVCAYFYKENDLKKLVVRIVGGYSEGSGFFIADDQILTNFHVIDNEPSPKIIFPNGYFTTPTKIIGDKNADLAVLYTNEPFPYMVMPLPEEMNLFDNEPLIAVGYPLGTGLAGQATILKGNFIDLRKSKRSPVSYLQTNIWFPTFKV